MGGKPAAQDIHDLGCVVHRQRGLQQERHALRVVTVTRLGLGGVLHQGDPARRLAERALDLVVPVVPDEQHRVTAADEPLRLGVHLRHERAGRVDDVQVAAGGLGPHGRRDAVRGEDDGGAVRHLVELLDEYRALPFEIGDDVRVVHDLAAHVDRARVALQRQPRRCRWPARRPRRTSAAPASTTRRGLASPAQRANAGPVRRSVCKRRAPAVTVAGRASGVSAVSAMTRTTATGMPPLGQRRAPTAADSMSTASAPVAASRRRSSALVTMWSVLTIGPACTRSPIRRSSATSGAAAAQHRAARAVAHLGGHHDVAGTQRGSSPPATPATATASGSTASSSGQPALHPRRPHAAAQHRRVRHPAAQRGVLAAQRGDHEQVSAHGDASGGQVAAERTDREDQPVHLVVDVEVAGEAGTGVAGPRPSRRRRAGRRPARRRRDSPQSVRGSTASSASSAHAVCDAVDAPRPRHDSST